MQRKVPRCHAERNIHRTDQGEGVSGGGFVKLKFVGVMRLHQYPIPVRIRNGACACMEGDHRFADIGNGRDGGIGAHHLALRCKVGIRISL